MIATITFSQNENEAKKLMEKISNQLIKKNGTLISFEYQFQNSSYKMDNAIIGKLALFANNQYYLEFDNSKIIQIYNGDILKTILKEEQEIQLDNIESDSNLLIQNILNNYQSNFDISIINKNKSKKIIQLVPKNRYNEIHNICIQELKLPDCLQMPNQCKIGIKKEDTRLLKECINEKGGYKEDKILKIEITVDNKSLVPEQINQFNKYNGNTSIQINEIIDTNDSILTIDSLLYQDFEIIDLR